MLSLWYFSLAVLVGIVNSQLNSPCPGQFQYDAKNDTIPGRWDGTLTLLSDSDLYGVWVRVIFDLPLAELKLHEDFGEIVTQDNRNHLIKNRNFILKADVPEKVGISVKYEGDKVPSLIGYRLNGRIVCPEQNRNVTWIQNKNQGSGDFFLGDLNNKDTLFSTHVAPPVEGCGIAPLHSATVPKGQKTLEGQWPWQASIFLLGPEGERYICGATLITSSTILTAAHCVTQKKNPVDVNLLRIYLGKYLLQGKNSNEQVVDVESVIPHPGYNPKNLKNDIAVIKLAKSVVINDYVRPVCLSADVEDDDVIRQEGFVTGYGFDDQKRQSDRLAQAVFRIEDDDDCFEEQPQLETLIDEKTFCASFAEEHPICVGDSGNGFVLLKEGPASVWQLQGVVTYGVALQNKFTCDKSSSIVVTDVSKYLKWIYANIS